MASVYSLTMRASRWAAWATPGAYTLLVGAMTVLGLIGSTEGLWIALAVLAAFVPSGWLAPGGWQRRAAEALLLPAAVAITMVPSAVMRQMMVAPLVFLAAWAAWFAAVRKAPGRSERVVLTAFFGVAVRIVIGLATVSSGWLGAGGVIVASAVVPGALAAVSPPLGMIAVFVTMAVTMHAGPTMVWLMTGIAIGVALVFSRAFKEGETGKVDRLFQALVGWYPGLGAVALVVMSLGTWGLPATGEILPGLNWIGGVIFIVILGASLRMPPAIAGACIVLACLFIGPSLTPTPEGGGLRLDQNDLETPLRAGSGTSYVVDVIVDNLEQVREGSKVATIFIGSKRVALRMHRGSDGRARVINSQANEVNGASNLGVWRPDRTWQRADRIVLDVPEGVTPVIQRRIGLAEEVVVRLVSSGPSKPTSPRDLEAERCFWLTAAAVALLQLISGLWRRNDAWPPWMLLAAGLMISRAAVEPLHLLVERHAVDLCLAALLLAWVPAAVGWVKRGRVFLAVGIFLVPMALATPHLTPSLWGDEPYHMALMESVFEDQDLDLENNLEGGGAVRDAIVSSDRLFHSPVLAGILLPGFLVAGRTGALMLLALAGAGLVAMVIKRFRQLRSPPDRAAVILVLIACLSYPLVTFSTQIWPGLLGALVIAAMLLLVSRGRWARLVAVALALVAVAAKTRLALVTLPVALAGWWRGSGRTRLTGVTVVGAAALGALLIGWMTMGHPFGIYRRLHHILPTDPVLAFHVVGGLLFDVAGGLAWTAPLWLVALVATPLLWRRGGDGERALLLGGGATVLALLHSIEWYAGGSPPGRYLVPMLPAVLLALGLLIARPDGRRRIIAFLFPVALAPWWILITRPHFSINPGDGRWWLTNALSRRFAADARALFPSFLTPGAATLIVPLVLIGLGGVLWWISRRPCRAWWLARVGPAVWLVAALGLVLAVDLRADTVVEAESAQIRRHGGAPAPPIGTPTRFSHANGWLLGGGDGLTVPLNLRGGERVDLEIRVVPPGWSGSLEVMWNDGAPSELKVRRGPGHEIITIPGPSDPGRHRLSIRWSGRKEAVLFVDRVIVIRE